MPEYTFTLILDRDPTAGDDDELVGALYAAGCDDALFGSTDSTHYGEFDREADSLSAALASAIADVRSAGIGVVHVEPDDAPRM